MAKTLESSGDSGLVAWRDHLHRRDVQECREDDFCQGRIAARPGGLFNSKLEGNTQRAIDFHEGDKIDETALKALIRAAVSLNTGSLKKVAKNTAGKATARPGRFRRNQRATRLQITAEANHESERQAKRRGS